MSWKARMIMSSGDSGTNNLAFKTKEEAEGHAKELFNRWLLPTDWEVFEDEQEVNAGFDFEHNKAVLNPLEKDDRT